MVSEIKSSEITLKASVAQVPHSYLVFNCPCGEEHNINLNALPKTTTRRLQLQQECKHARHIIIHSGHPRYRKIMIISEYGEEICE